ncbi:MAG: tRNA (adenosine(37)-N6)-dimethylallyltransferase MiaA [Nitrospiraceae bacterium]|nr:MAG: tRNA (adenosine(37)-N6)-dimethylallyltransferase MiaA [Nitrospiraceae bacterium]
MNKVIIILGPTGVGKTGFSLLLAKKLNTEIISADSMLVYSHMDIGTAKPSTEERASVPHHLINILSPKETFSAGLFKEMATIVINNLHDRDLVPLVVGGTGLYIRSLTKGLFDGPSADLTMREELKKKEEDHGPGYLHKMLINIDPETAVRIEPNDRRRVIRALEVSLTEQKKISHIRNSSTKPLHYDFLKIGLTRDRKELYSMIEERVDNMMEKGLLAEVRELLEMEPGRTAMQALGYKELGLYLKGEIDVIEAVRLIKKRTKMFAKRQYTWFNREPDVHWVDISGIHGPEEIYDRVTSSVAILKEFN